MHARTARLHVNCELLQNNVGSFIRLSAIISPTSLAFNLQDT